MPYKVCKQCGEAFGERQGVKKGPPRQYCDKCGTQSMVNARARARKEGREYNPDAFSCLVCGNHADQEQAMLYPFCSEACQEQTLPALARRCRVSDKALRILIERGGLLIALQDSSFDDDALDNLCEQLSVRRIQDAPHSTIA